MSNIVSTTRSPTCQNLMGEKFDHLTVVEYVGTNKWHQALWKCQCDCGGIVIRSNRVLKSPQKHGCDLITCPYGILASRTKISPEDRFWDKVDKSCVNGCWVWSAYCRKNRRGYGVFGFKAGLIKEAHRFSYELAFGPFDESLFVLHKCDNPPCVNPAHLFLGTRADNTADMLAKGRQARGERQGGAKLTSEQVIDLCKRFDAGESALSLSRELGVNESRVYAITSGRSWAWLTGRGKKPEMRARREWIEELGFAEAARVTFGLR